MRLDLLLEDFPRQKRGQYADQVLDDVRDHPSLEETPSYILATGFALVFAPVDRFCALCDLEIQPLKIMATRNRNGGGMLFSISSRPQALHWVEKSKCLLGSSLDFVFMYYTC